MTWENSAGTEYSKLTLFEAVKKVLQIPRRNRQDIAPLKEWPWTEFHWKKKDINVDNDDESDYD